MPAVLLVEDDPTNRLVALSMLSHLGIEADFAVNGQEGVTAASCKKYSAILMDLQMPVMDGMEAMRTIRQMIPGPSCPRIVAVTAHAVAGTREALLAAGFDAVYNKPISITMMTEAVYGATEKDASPPDDSAEPHMIITPRTEDDDQAAKKTLRDAVRAHVRALLGEEDEDFVTDLVTTFSESSRGAVEEATQARDSDDVVGIAIAAHKLKGSASNVGLNQLATTWGAIEATIRADGTIENQPLESALNETHQALASLAG